MYIKQSVTSNLYPLSLHDALPILGLLERSHSYKDKLARGVPASAGLFNYPVLMAADVLIYEDRKSTRLNSSHANISYAVFCLKKKNCDICILLLQYVNAYFYMYTY